MDSQEGKKGVSLVENESWVGSLELRARGVEAGRILKGMNGGSKEENGG